MREWMRSVEHDGQSRVQVRIVAQHRFDEFATERIVLEQSTVRFEIDESSVFVGCRFRRFVGQGLQALTDESTEPTADENGTFIYFEPDSALFKNYTFRSEFIETMLRNYTYLNTGLTIMFNRTPHPFPRNGLVDLLNDNMTNDGLYPIIHLKGEDIEIAFTRTGRYGEEDYSFVNGQHTTQGGTHQSAFKKHIAETIKDFSGKNFDYERQSVTDVVAAIARSTSKNRSSKARRKSNWGTLTTIPDGGISIDKFVGDFVKEQVRQTRSAARIRTSPTSSVQKITENE